MGLSLEESLASLKSILQNLYNMVRFPFVSTLWQSLESLDSLEFQETDNFEKITLQRPLPLFPIPRYGFGGSPRSVGAVCDREHHHPRNSPRL